MFIRSTEYIWVAKNPRTNQPNRAQFLFGHSVYISGEIIIDTFIYEKNFLKNYALSDESAGVFIFTKL